MLGVGACHLDMILIYARALFVFNFSCIFSLVVVEISVGYTEFVHYALDAPLPMAFSILAL